MNIYLLGFMGAGKTRLGKALAQKMNYRFYDLDQMIVDEECMSINSIFDRKGETYFRQLEQRLLQQSAHFQHAVISTGGGSPCYFDNMARINQQGLSVFLDAQTAILAKRLWRGRYKRPLIKNLNKKELNSFIQKKLAERLPFYQQAQLSYLIDNEKTQHEEQLYQLILETLETVKK